MTTELPDPYDYVPAIQRSGLSIYDHITIGDPSLWIPATALEFLLDNSLRGFSLAGLPLRTRSKVVKERVCVILGYPIPKSFQKTKPRFPGQIFDIYTQKSNNLQVWNEELSPTRRYVIIRISDEDVVTKVKVVTGDRIAALDKTGTLTKKYQARGNIGATSTELVSPVDTPIVSAFLGKSFDVSHTLTPIENPKSGKLLPITIIFERLSSLIGRQFPDAGSDQERNRGAALHRMVCAAIGYRNYQDDGQFPDVRHQLIEVKLQTSPTIDLGLVKPDSQAALDMPMILGNQLRHCDVRYAVFFAVISNKTVEITHLILVTGEDFFTRFTKFQGKILNSKLQIPLPESFFES